MSLTKNSSSPAPALVTITKISSSPAPSGHVAVCTWPFSSHPFAFFNLVHKLAKEAPQVQFSFFSSATTNSTILSTHKTSNHQFPSNIKIYNVDVGIPEGIDPMAIDHFEEVSCFIKQVPNNFKKRIDSLMAEAGDEWKAITCIMADAVLSFGVAKMAEEMNVPWIAFTVPTPHDLVCYFEMEKIKQLYANAQGRNDQDGNAQINIIPGLSSLPFKDIPHEIHLSNPSNVIVPYLSSMVQKLPQASALLVNSYEEFNHNLLTDYLKSKVKNLLYVGCLTLSISVLAEYSNSTDNSTIPDWLLSWLDGQKVASIVYISFGTVAELAPEELKALAEALEISNVPFLWSLKDKFKKLLPNGFLERTKMHGKVVPWVPQKQVLEHSSVGVFVMHGGYNSMWESILGGVPMICRSFWADNHINAKIAEELWGVAVRIEGRVLTKNGMLKCLTMVFEDEKGEKMRKACYELKQVLVKAAGPDGAAAKHFKTLLQLITG